MECDYTHLNYNLFLRTKYGGVFFVKIKRNHLTLVLTTKKNPK